MLNANDCFIFIFVLILNVSVFAGEKKELILDEIKIIGEKVTVPTKQTGDTVYTGTVITQKGIELSGEKGKSNVYEAISILPGIVFESPDVNNLTGEQSNIRIRGVSGTLGAMTVEGIPNYGGNPMGPRSYIYDLENFESIAVYKGAIPADLGSGVGNRGGAIELRPKWATKDFRFLTSQSVGSYEYKKTFLRLDTGKISSFNSMLSLSYSFTEEDKWKGPGDIGPRHNINFSYVQPIGEKVEVKLWANFNKLKYNNYRSLNYEQAKNIDEYYRLDFNDSLLGNSSEDYLYYKFNKAKHKNIDFITVITIKPIDKIKFTIKPYFSKEDANLWDGSPYVQGFPGVQNRTRKIDRKGIISKITLKLNNFSVAAGYLYESSDMNINTNNLRIHRGDALKDIIMEFILHQKQIICTAHT
jgi:iron complex outermembrane receptor protein